MIEIFKKNNNKKNLKDDSNNINNNCSNSVTNIDKTDNKSISNKPHPINPNNLTGEIFGDYIVVDANERDGSGHKLWRCVCPTCGDSFKATSYDLIKGRKKTICKKCENTRLDDTSTSTVTNPSIAYSTYNTIDNNNNTDYTEVSSVPAINKYEEKAIFFNTTADGFKKEKYAQICSDVFVRELKEDLLSMPVYYNIAHCIPADFTVHGLTAKRIDEVYSLVNILKHDYLNYGVYPDVGDVIYLNNVFTLFATSKKYMRPTLDDIRKCVNELAKSCVDLGIQYLAMPRIGCGHNKLNWDEVKDVICEEFKKVYTDAIDSRVIRITFCYQ